MITLKRGERLEKFIGQTVDIYDDPATEEKHAFQAQLIGVIGYETDLGEDQALYAFHVDPGPSESIVTRSILVQRTTEQSPSGISLPGQSLATASLADIEQFVATDLEPDDVFPINKIGDAPPSVAAVKLNMLLQKVQAEMIDMRNGLVSGAATDQETLDQFINLVGLYHESDAVDILQDDINAARREGLRNG